MRVILLRHGIAEEVGTGGVDRDADRPLSEAGWRKTRRGAAGLATLLHEDVRIVSSPLVRARQTAACLEDALREAGPDRDRDTRIEICEALALWADRDGVLAHIREGEDVEDVVLVGHQPDMGSLSSWLLTGGEDVRIAFKKAAALCISFPGRIGLGSGVLAWYLPPRVLRALAR